MSITATKEDVKRILDLEDRLFELTLKFHLRQGHRNYLNECEDMDCVKNRVLLGEDLFMLKYGQALP